MDLLASWMSVDVMLRTVPIEDAEHSRVVTAADAERRDVRCGRTQPSQHAAICALVLSRGPVPNTSGEGRGAIRALTGDHNAVFACANWDGMLTRIMANHTLAGVGRR